MPSFLELCSGTAVMSKRMKELGWNTTTVDIDPSFNSDIVGDIRTMVDKFSPGEYDVVFCSPPCDEFTKYVLPWHELKKPSMDIAIACARIIRAINPKLWFIENVNGARKFFKPVFGDVTFAFGLSWFVWGSYIGVRSVPVSVAGRNKINTSGKVKRASYHPMMVEKLCAGIDRRYRELVV